jgi:endo-1,4-beta-mannosidase
MLQAITKGILSRSFQLEQENQLIGEFDPSLWREKAQLELEDGTYELYREGAYRGDFLLEKNGKIVARAAKPSAFRGQFEVEVSNRRLVLRKPSIWNRRFGVFDGEKEIGAIQPLGLLRRRTNIDLPSDWPLAVRIFLFWLAFLMWKRESAAAS